MTLELYLNSDQLFSLLVESVNIYTDKLNFKDFTYNNYYNKKTKKVELFYIYRDYQDQYITYDSFLEKTKVIKYVINYKNNCDIDLDNLLYKYKNAYIEYNFYNDTIISKNDDFYKLDINFKKIFLKNYYENDFYIKNFIYYDYLRNPLYSDCNCCYTPCQTKKKLFMVKYNDYVNNLEKFIKNKRLKDKYIYISDPYCEENFIESESEYEYESESESESESKD